MTAWVTRLVSWARANWGQAEAGAVELIARDIGTAIAIPVNLTIGFTQSRLFIAKDYKSKCPLNFRELYILLRYLTFGLQLDHIITGTTRSYFFCYVP